VLRAIASEIDFPKVRTFLESVARGSVNSKCSYGIGLKHFQCFLSSNSDNNNNNYYQNYNIETIPLALQSNTVNVYELLDSFVSYLVRLPRQPPIAPTSIALYVYAVRSYLQYYDIDINPYKFRRRVRLPKVPREDERPIDASDIRNILLACNNRRLKAYILVLASGGMRAIEGLAIRYKDLDFSISPTRVHIRKEFTKTKAARDIYISDEATTYLKQWLDWKYREERILKTGNRTTTKTPVPDDLVFSPFVDPNPAHMYQKLSYEFHKLLKVVGLDGRKENSLRGVVTFHSFRRFVKTVISDATNQDYSEWFLGHRKSPYYTNKESQLRELYRTKCMPLLTFLNFAEIESTSRDVKDKLEEKDREIERLRELESLSRDAITSLSERLMQLEARFDKKQDLINNQHL
jgi:integrase